MTDNELIVFADVARELANTRKAKEGYLRDSINDARKIAALERDLKSAKAVVGDVQEELQKHLDRIRELEAERDEARKKLGALAVCVGFQASYNFKTPGKSLRELFDSVRKVFADYNIVLGEGGLAK